MGEWVGNRIHGLQDMGILCNQGHVQILIEAIGSLQGFHQVQQIHHCLIEAILEFLQRIRESVPGRRCIQNLLQGRNIQLPAECGEILS
ncbi:hypothetical protein D3C73_729530 [compost metagenome]